MHLFVNCGQTFLGADLRLPRISVQVTPQCSSVNPRHLGPGPASGTLQTAPHSDQLPSGSTACFIDLTYCWLLGCFLFLFLIECVVKIQKWKHFLHKNPDFSFSQNLKSQQPLDTFLQGLTEAGRSLGRGCVGGSLITNHPFFISLPLLQLCVPCD